MLNAAGRQRGSVVLVASRRQRGTAHNKFSQNGVLPLSGFFSGRGRLPGSSWGTRLLGGEPASQDAGPVEIPHPDRPGGTPLIFEGDEARVSEDRRSELAMAAGAYRVPAAASGVRPALGLEKGWSEDLCRCPCVGKRRDADRFLAMFRSFAYSAPSSARTRRIDLCTVKRI